MASGTGDADTSIPATNLIESLNGRPRKVSRGAAAGEACQEWYLPEALWAADALNRGERDSFNDRICSLGCCRCVACLRRAGHLDAGEFKILNK